MKYSEILQTISNENVWKIFKNILGWKENLNQLENMYFDLIMTDIDAIDKRAWDWNKGWRPESKPKVIEKVKPKVIEKVKPSIVKTSIVKTNIDKISKEKISNEKKFLEFVFFWDWYKKKVWDKNKCEKKRNKLKLDEQEKILEILPRYLSWIKDKQFQPFPETFLNQRRWENHLEDMTWIKEPETDQERIDLFYKIKKKGERVNMYIKTLGEERYKTIFTACKKKMYDDALNYKK